MKDELKITLTAPASLCVETRAADPLCLQLGNAVSGTRDYNRLQNKPTINGVELAGNQTSASLYIVSENTVSGWAQTPMYVPKQGEIILYTDYAEDDQGNPLPAIKMGDGSAFVADLPFVNDDIRNNLLAHINDRVVHITDEERRFWNNKLNYEYDMGEETLILNRN